MSLKNVGINSINRDRHLKESSFMQDSDHTEKEHENENIYTDFKKSQSYEHFANDSPIKQLRSNTMKGKDPTKGSMLGLCSTSRMFSRRTIDKYESLIVRTQSRTGTLDQIDKNLLVDEEGSQQDDTNDQEIEEGKEASFKWLLKSCIEEALSFALEWAPSTIILYFITQNNDQDTVSGFGMGVFWSNCIGQGLYYGLCSGFETMASHANGNKNYQLVGFLYYKTIFISLIMFIPILLSMIFSESILRLWNSEDNYCYIASQYCQLSLPGIFIALFYYSLKALLNAQNEFKIQVYTASINLAMIFPYSYLFIQHLDMGVKGAAIVFILSEATCLTLLSLFTYFKKELRKCFVPFSREIFKDVMGYLKVAVPIGSIVAAEWIIFELNTILSSNLSSDQYSAHIVLSNFSAMCFQFQIGYSTAAATFISNEMGCQNVKNALKYTKYALYIIVGHVAVVVLPLIFLRNIIAEIYTVDQEVQDALLSVYFIFIGCHVLESFNSIASAYMRAIAQEKFTSICFFVCYGLVGLLSSYLLAYQADLGLKGIWFGMAIAIGLYAILLGIQVLRVDIYEMAKIIALRMEEEEEESQSDQLSIQAEHHNETMKSV